MSYKLYLLLLFSFSSQLLVGQNWELAKNKDEIKVYTRKVAGWGIKEYKAVTTINASFVAVMTTLKDVSSRKHWLHNTIEVREVERSANKISIYNKVDAPWPVSDRDNITEFEFLYPSEGCARIEMKVVKSHAKAPVYSGIVRIERLKGHWLVTDKGNGRVEVIQQCVADPGGSIPDWLANSSVVDSPYNTMLKFKAYVEGK